MKIKVNGIYMNYLIVSASFGFSFVVGSKYEDHFMNVFSFLALSVFDLLLCWKYRPM